MESEIISNIFVICYTKIHVVLSVDHLAMYDFVIACIGHLENIGSLGYAALPSVGIVYYAISKVHFCYYYYPSKQKRH